VLRIALGSVWQPGQWIDISLEYVIQIPDCAFRFGAASGIYTLGNAFPILSVWENGAWRTEEYFPLGDPFYANCANYSVTLAVPRGYQCAGSAYGEKTETDGKWVFTFDAPAVREFALSISDRFATAQETVGDVLVTSYGLTTQTAWKALKYASQALVCFNEQYGAYPYRHLAIAAVDFPYGGMEYPSLVLIQKSAYEADSEQSLETLIAHEVAHQWWYAVVGSDQFYQPWQDEALAEYALLDYTGKYYGKDARDNLAFSRFETAMRVTIPEGVTPGSPIDYFGSMSEYSLVVYRRGASLMVALETSLGDKFHDFLRTYYQRQAFRLSSRADFEQTLKEVSGQDWSALIVDYLDTYINN
jgi:aminopeptidase N